MFKQQYTAQYANVRAKLIFAFSDSFFQWNGIPIIFKMSISQDVDIYHASLYIQILALPLPPSLQFNTMGEGKRKFY